MTSFDEFLITCPKADIDTMRAAKDGTLLARFVWDKAQEEILDTFEKMHGEIKQLQKENDFLRSLMNSRHRSGETI